MLSPVDALGKWQTRLWQASDPSPVVQNETNLSVKKWKNWAYLPGIACVGFAAWAILPMIAAVWSATSLGLFSLKCAGFVVSLILTKVMRSRMAQSLHLNVNDMERGNKTARIAQRCREVVTFLQTLPTQLQAFEALQRQISAEPQIWPTLKAINVGILNKLRSLSNHKVSADDEIALKSILEGVEQLQRQCVAVERIVTGYLTIAHIVVPRLVSIPDPDAVIVKNLGVYNEWLQNDPLEKIRDVDALEDLAHRLRTLVY